MADTQTSKNEKLRQNIVARFMHQCKQLISDDEKKVAQAESRIPALIEEAEKAEFALPAPSALGVDGVDDNELFAGYEFGAAPAAPAPAATKEEAKAKATAARAAAKAEKKPPREKKAPRGTFKPGHDAKLKSLLLKIERGESETEALTGTGVEELVKFKLGPKAAKGEKQTRVCTQAPVKLRDDASFTRVDLPVGVRIELA